MTKFEHLLCPVDISLPLAADESLRYSIALARAFDAKLSIIHCAVGVNPETAWSQRATHENLLEVINGALKRYAGDGMPAQPDWECAIIGGDHAGEEIIREAADRKADLIVMATRGGALRAALLGSTAEVVCRSAPCPVLVTRQQERGWVGMSSGDLKLNRLLVAYDFSNASMQAFELGTSLAQEYQSELHMLYVLPKPSEEELEIAWNPSVREGAYHEAARNLHYAIPSEVHLWCRRVVHTVRWGEPYDEILTYAGENNIDLICMGASGAGFKASALFGSNTDRVLRQSPCPVMVARKG